MKKKRLSDINWIVSNVGLLILIVGAVTAIIWSWDVTRWMIGDAADGIWGKVVVVIVFAVIAGVTGVLMFLCYRLTERLTALEKEAEREEKEAEMDEEERKLMKEERELEGKSAEERIEWYRKLARREREEEERKESDERMRRKIIKEKMRRHEYKRRWEEKCGWSLVEIEDDVWAYVNGEGEYLNEGETFMRAGEFEGGSALVTLYGDRCRFSGEEWQWNNIIDAEGRLMFPERWGNSLERIEPNGGEEEPVEKRLYYYSSYSTGPGFGIRRSKENEYNIHVSDVGPEYSCSGTYIVRRDGSYVFDIMCKRKAIHGLRAYRLNGFGVNRTGIIEEVTKESIKIREDSNYYIYFIDSGVTMNMPVYEKEERVKGNIYIVSWEGKYGVFDVKTNRRYLPIGYGSIEASADGNFIVSAVRELGIYRTREYGVVDIHNHTILGLRYNRIEVVEEDDGNGGKTWRYKVWRGRNEMEI